MKNTPLAKLALGEGFEDLAAVPKALANMGGMTPAQVDAAMVSGPRRVPNPCHHCGAPATAQWQRRATDDEHEAHWAATEQNIRASGTPEYVADRSGSVTKAVFGCDDHDLSPAPADDANAAKYEARQIGAQLRALTHAADCGGHGACGCGEAGA